MDNPRYHSLWFPNNITTTIYGYLTDLPSTVYYRETHDSALLDSVKNMFQSYNFYTIFTSLVIITFSTTERPDNPDPHLHTNEFQITIAAQENGHTPFIMMYYQRLDSLLGVAGFSIPSCTTYTLTRLIHSQTLMLRSTLIRSPGAHAFYASSSCNLDNTGMKYFRKRTRVFNTIRHVGNFKI